MGTIDRIDSGTANETEDTTLKGRQPSVSESELESLDLTQIEGPLLKLKEFLDAHSSDINNAMSVFQQFVRSDLHNILVHQKGTLRKWVALECQGDQAKVRFLSFFVMLTYYFAYAFAFVATLTRDRSMKQKMQLLLCVTWTYRI